MSTLSEELSVELYKSLRQECAGYIEKIPGLWHQKFVLVGGVVPFILASRGDLGKLSSDHSTAIIVVAISSIPILAIVIDARTLEYGLHARAISRFIEEHYTMPSMLPQWEQTLWSTVADALPLC